MKRFSCIGILILIGGLGLYSCLTDSLFTPGGISAYLLLMVFPGAALYLLLEKHLRPVELALSATVLSPVLAGSGAVIALAFGLSARAALIVLALASITISAVSLARNVSLQDRREIDGRQAVTLAGIIFLFCVLIGYLPLSNEWWRIRSDAWFHTAVVAQIADYGVPPEDPYFYGLTLQYMWFFHALVLLLSQAIHVSAFTVMPLLNIQAIIGFSLSTLLISLLFKKHFKYGTLSMITGVLGLNAFFWVFLPIKLGRAFTGEIRGMAEVSRVLSLSPLNIKTVREFVRIHQNQEFFLDKFIVSTALSTGLCLMAAAWYGVTSSLSQKRTSMIVFAFLASVGMMAFHTIVGFVTIAGLLGGLILFQWKGFGTESADRRQALKLILVLLAGLIVLSPYLYVVLHGKESEQLLPFGISFVKIASIVISCALGFFLAAFQLKRLLAERTPEARFLLLATLSIVVVCLAIKLPALNAYDKFPFFIYFPLGVVGGWTLAELPLRSATRVRRGAVMALVLIVLFLPLNLIQMLGYFAQPVEEVVTPWEQQIAAWVRDNTSRDAVFIDSNDRVFLVAAGPRRYYWGTKQFASQWGYDKDEMTRRRRLRDNLYSDEPLTDETLHQLGGIDEEVYVIARDDEGTGGFEKLSRYPDLFQQLHSAGPITVLRVERARCREAAKGGSWQPNFTEGEDS
ncbi:MAG: hypothetical protein GTO29_11245 [Candidatus Latescibacteria bacterium]|nr:hypothetical protein [Candidatus Latescibacterota bacterium]NIO56739.1 hypothetical protein [Candidatus Latescibacterota bacterium]NIT02324.1 hypothetical protein [Candidatus Latescibacterota bacterium]NIT39207.1 hypothetical protein [Candidatus Latescibacterota bacterium]